MALATVCGVPSVSTVWQDCHLSYEHQLSNHAVPGVLFSPVQMPMMPGRHSGVMDKSCTKIDVNHGTTTLAFKVQQGIILATDTRATAGSYIGSQTVKKLTEINPYIVATIAGGAADCQYWERVLARQCRLYELRNKEGISVAAASKMLANILHSYKGSGLSVGTLICGIDKRGPSIYYVDDDGSRFSHDLISVGSGSTYAYGVLDQGYRFDMPVKEAADLAQRAIYHATFRDAGSGGLARVYQLTASGLSKLSGDDVAELHYKFKNVKAA